MFCVQASGHFMRLLRLAPLGTLRRRASVLRPCWVAIWTGNGCLVLAVAFGGEPGICQLDFMFRVAGSSLPKVLLFFALRAGPARKIGVQTTFPLSVKHVADSGGPLRCLANYEGQLHSQRACRQGRLACNAMYCFPCAGAGCCNVRPQDRSLCPVRHLVASDRPKFATALIHQGISVERQAFPISWQLIVNHTQHRSCT